MSMITFIPRACASRDEPLQIFGCAVIRIDSVVVANGVRAADRSLLLLLADRMNRHQPENRDAEILEIVETSGDRVEVSLLRKRARIDFVDHAVAHPIAHRPRRLLRVAATESANKHAIIREQSVSDRGLMCCMNIAHSQHRRRRHQQD